MQEEEEPEEQTTPRPDRTESPLGEGAEEFLRAEMGEHEVIGEVIDPEMQVGAHPVPLPEVPQPVNVDDISFQPVPLPDVPEPTEVGMDPDPVLRGDPEAWGKWEGPEVTEPAEFQVEEVSSNPVPIPDPGMEAGFGDEVSVLPIPNPNPELTPDNDMTGLEEEPFEEPLE